MPRFFSNEELDEILTTLKDKIPESTYMTASFIFAIQALSQEEDMTKEFVLKIFKDQTHLFSESIKNKILAAHLSR